MKIGLVFEGGGGKGAYQIGVWKALQEMNIDSHIYAVSGTSVGALNAVLFYMGGLNRAEKIWSHLSNEDILQIKDDNNYEDGFFSQNKLSSIIASAISRKKENQHTKKCFVTCKKIEPSEVMYFEWSKYWDIEYKKKILLASSAIPIVYENVEIDGELYMDGGVPNGGDNTPIIPLLDEKLEIIIVVHLGDKKIHDLSVPVIEINPSKNIGRFITGTIDFDHDSIIERINQGYEDALLNERLVDLSNAIKLKDSKTKLKNNTNTKKNNKNNFKGGSKMDNFKFTNEDARKQYSEKYEALEKIASEKVIDKKFLWDATVKKYATRMMKVKNILSSEGISEQITSKMFKDIDLFLKRCADAEFHIALVGAIKAGKSTLINALLGYEYASTKITPETAALTKFKKASCNYVKLKFYSSHEWDILWKSAVESKASVFMEEYEKLQAEKEKLNWLDKEVAFIECDSRELLVEEIQKWTSSKSAQHYFVKEVEVGLEEFKLPNGVVLVDTPGLDDVVEYRSNITREYIDRANAVLVCVKADALTGPEMATIYSVFSNTRYNPEKVYIIATQLDTINRPKEGWIAQQEEWLKYLKGKSAYGSSEMAKRNLIPVSAYLYTLLGEYNNISEEDDKFWDLDSIIRKLKIKDVNEHYQELLEFTNIELLKARIQNEIVANYKKILIDDIIGSYEICKETIKNTMESIKNTQEEMIVTSQGGIEEIRKKKQEYSERYEEAEKDKQELEKLLKQLEMATTKRADELTDAIKKLK